jgi:GDP-D-mannose 3',5'-epimerase
MLIQALAPACVTCNRTSERSFARGEACALRLMKSDYAESVNIGSEEMVTINQLAAMIMKISAGEAGVGTLAPLREGLEKTYRWIEEEVRVPRATQVAIVA